MNMVNPLWHIVVGCVCAPIEGHAEIAGQSSDLYFPPSSSPAL